MNKDNTPNNSAANLLDEENMQDDNASETDDNEASGVNWAKVFALKGCRDARGVVDLSSVMQMLEQEAKFWCDANEFAPEVIEKAVDKAYDGHPNTKWDITSLPNRAIRELDVAPSNETRALKQVQAWLRGESKLFEQTGNGKYVVRKGRKTGGVSRVNDALRKEWEKAQAEENE